MYTSRTDLLICIIITFKGCGKIFLVTYLPTTELLCKRFSPSFIITYARTRTFYFSLNDRLSSFFVLKLIVIIVKYLAQKLYFESVNKMYVVVALSFEIKK